MVLKKKGTLFPVEGDTLVLHAPCKLEVLERKENEIIFGVTELLKTNPNNFKEYFVEAGSGFFTD